MQLSKIKQRFNNTSDPKVAGAGVTVKTGRKRRAEKAVEGAEIRLQHKMVMGTIAKGKAGLGFLEVPRYDKAQGKERRQLIQEEIRSEVEERTVRAVTMKQQGAWTKWEQANVRKVTWNDLWKMQPQNIQVPHWSCVGRPSKPVQFASLRPNREAYIPTLWKDWDSGTYLKLLSKSPC